MTENFSLHPSYIIRYYRENSRISANKNYFRQKKTYFGNDIMSWVLPGSRSVMKMPLPLNYIHYIHIHSLLIATAILSSSVNIKVVNFQWENLWPPQKAAKKKENTE